MNAVQTPEGQRHAVLDGSQRAQRPTGPVLGVVVVLVCLFAGQLLASAVLLPLFGVPASAVLGDMDALTQFVTLLADAGALLLLALWLWFKERRPFYSLGFFPARRIATPVGLGAVAGMVALSLPVVVNLLSGQYEVQSARLSVGALAVLIGFAVQASTEEVLTRGYLLQVTHRRWGLGAALALQAVLFAALHLSNLDVSVIALLNIVLIGLLLGFWALAEGSLWGVCAFHTVWNWAQGNVYGVEVSGLGFSDTWWNIADAPGGSELLTGGGFGVEGSLITTVVLLAALIPVVLVWRKNRAGA